jgi:hypothetical protein
MSRSSFQVIAFICAFALVGCSGISKHESSLPPLPLPQPHVSPLLGPTTGGGSEILTVSSRLSVLYYFVGCAGARTVTVETTQGTFGVSCNNESVASDSFTQPKPDRLRKISIRIVASSSATWELRVDGAHVTSPSTVHS